MNCVIGKTLLCALVLASVAGCVTPSKQASAKKSLALEVANAGGLHQQLRDTVVPMNTGKRLADKAGFQMADLAISGSFGLTGLSKGGSAFAVLAGNVLRPTSHAERSSFIAWMPKALASSTKDAQEKMQQLFAHATNKTLDELGLVHREVLVDRKRGFNINNVIDDARNCVTVRDKNGIDNGTCVAVTYVPEPTTTPTPRFLSSGSADGAYGFAAGGSTYGSATFKTRNDAEFNEYQYLKALSQSLPEWVYIYVAPKTFISQKEKKPVGIPIILNQGAEHFFIVEE